MHELRAIRGVLAAVASASVAFMPWTGGAAEPAPAAAAAALPPRVEDPKAVYRVPPEDSPARGPRDALVTIVGAMDFECPYCKQASQTMRQLDQAYAGRLRFVFKENPLSNHANALPAAILAEEARAEGGDAKFWAMHDKLYELASIDGPSLEKVAEELKLSPSKVKAALAGWKYVDRIRRDQMLMYGLSALGTPSFFINGRKVLGAQPLEAFKAVVDEELKKAEKLAASGVARKNVYAAIIKRGATAPVMIAAPAAPAARVLTPVSSAGKVALRPDDPVKGSQMAPVTLVLFSDFQCPFCGKVEPTLKQLEQAYPGKLRIAWKHQPLPMHPNALPAAKAAEAARAQGKFWEMHDKLFANQQALSDAIYAQYAKDLGLDLKRFQRDVADESTAKRISEDQQVAASAGATGTPTSFVNCRKMVGALPLESFKAIIDEETKKAEAMMAKGEKAGPGLYQKLCEANVAAAPAVAAGGPRKDVAVPIRSDDPARGRKNARITVVEFSDFQCPYCSRAEPAVGELEKAHASDIRLVWKHMPLGMHPNAMPAAIAAEAARQQGKFWEMHDKLFAGQQALSDAIYAQYAKELGLDLKRFQAALQSSATRQRVEEDVRTAAAAGVNGTPTFVVNGEVVVGSGGLRDAVERQLQKNGPAKEGSRKVN